MSIQTTLINLAVQQIQTALNLEERVYTLVDSYKTITKENALELCPTREVLEELLRFKIQSEKTLDLTLKKLTSLKKVTSTVQNVTTVLQPLTVLLKTNPAPSIGTTVGLQTTNSDALENIKDAIKVANGTAASANLLITFIEDKVTSIQSALSRLDLIFSLCGPERGLLDLGSIANLQAVKDGVITEQSKGAPVLYRGYTVTITVIENRTDGLVRRQARGADKSGAIKFYSKVSFATDDQVLIDNVKLQIDNSF